MALPYSTLNSQVLPSIEPIAYDNVYTGDALLARLRSKATVKAAKYYQKVLQYALQNMGGWYSGIATYNPKQPEILTRASYTRKQLIEPYRITNDDEMDAGVPEKILDIVATRAKNALLRLKTNLIAGIYASCTSSAVEGNATVGLADIIDTADPVTWYVGNIQVADMAVWVGNVYDKSTTTFGIGSGSYVKMTAAKLRYLVDQLTAGAGQDLTGELDVTQHRPTLIVTTWPIYGMMRGWCAAKQQFTFQGKNASYGFQTMDFEGVDVMASDYMTTNLDGYMYILNENVYGLAVYPGWDVKMKPIHPDESGTSSIGQVLWSGATYCWDRNRLAVVKDIDASA